MAYKPALASCKAARVDATAGLEPSGSESEHRRVALHGRPRLILEGTPRRLEGPLQEGATAGRVAVAVIAGYIVAPAKRHILVGHSVQLFHGGSPERLHRALHRRVLPPRLRHPAGARLVQLLHQLPHRRHCEETSDAWVP